MIKKRVYRCVSKVPLRVTKPLNYINGYNILEMFQVTFYSASMSIKVQTWPLGVRTYQGNFV